MSGAEIDLPVFRPGAPSDWPKIETMLADAGLPLDGARDHLAGFVVGEIDGAIVCAGALEHYGQAALLRSVVVSAAQRGSGVGGQMFNVLVAEAKSRGIGTLYLLTTTAAPFFARRGFAVDLRDAVPAALHASREFQGACPTSATLMSLSLLRKEAR